MCAVGMESSHQILWSGSPQCRHAFLPRQRSRDEAAFQKPLLDRLKSGLTRLKPTATFPVDFLNDSKENEPGKVPPSRPPGTACLALCRGLALSAGHSGPTTGGVPSASRAHKACVGKQRLLLTGCHLFSRDTSGQGRFCTIFRSYSRGAQVTPPCWEGRGPCSNGRVSLSGCWEHRLTHRPMPAFDVHPALSGGSHALSIRTCVPGLHLHLPVHEWHVGTCVMRVGTQIHRHVGHVHPRAHACVPARV